jgi:hypothetical protein
LAANGTIISYDPLKTSLPIKILRTIYRPFSLMRLGNAYHLGKKNFYQFRAVLPLLKDEEF